MNKESVGFMDVAIFYLFEGVWQQILEGLQEHLSLLQYLEHAQR